MHKHLNPDTLPGAFCWTRFGPDAGEPIETIIARKETERRAGDGTFYWGIGSAVGRAMEALAAEVEQPELLFSPIAGTPRAVDVSPGYVARWVMGRTGSGESVPLPRHVCITSRWDPDRANTPRYALVCASEETLQLDDHGTVSFGSLRNLVSDAPLGASQVTAVVRRDLACPASGRTYRIAMRVRLAWPYVLRLEAPTVLVERADAVPDRPLSLTV